MCADVKCALCGAPNEEIDSYERCYYASYRRPIKVERVQLRRGLLLCDSCERGLASGEYAAVGVAHELRAMKNGRAYDVPKGIRPLLSKKLPGPTWLISSPMSLANILAAHEKGRCARHGKPIDPQSCEPGHINAAGTCSQCNVHHAESAQ